MKKLEYNQRDAGVTYLWALALPLIISLIIVIVCSGSPVDASGKALVYSETWFLCLLRLVTAGMFIGLFFVYNKQKQISFRACGITQKSSPYNILICVALAFALTFLTDPLITTISYWLQSLGITMTTTIELPLTNFGWYLLVLFLVGVLPAIGEELVFRGMIFNGLKSKGKWTAILLSALAFSLMHENVGQLLYTFILGVVLGYIMWETKALWLTMLVHFVNNAIVITYMYIATQQGTLTTTLTEPTGAYIGYAIGMFAVAVVVVIALLYLLKKLNKKKEKGVSETKENMTETSQNEIIDLVLLVVGFILAGVLTIINTI